jgi:hypothetical protein
VTLPDPRKANPLGLVHFLRQLATATEEADTDYNGPLSYPGEWHALGVGAALGATYAVTADPEAAAALGSIIYGGGKLGSRHLRDARDELAYTAGGAALGYVFPDIVAWATSVLGSLPL